MKLVLIVFNSSIEDVVIESLKNAGIDEYTKFDDVLGVGKSSEPHMGTHIWPSTNSMLMISCENDKAAELAEEIKRLKEEHRKLGIKAFFLNEESAI
ncbi:MAG: hypothetical protein B6D63_02995 [Candidatus Latescibacteria bacterium 4484_7]|nr:MAG: hypothetical protein B6D63_02995 [Candidatus Latescibacteria bacterium 4484_7]